MSLKRVNGRTRIFLSPNGRAKRATCGFTEPTFPATFSGVVVNEAFSQDPTSLTPITRYSSGALLFHHLIVYQYTKSERFCQARQRGGVRTTLGELQRTLLTNKILSTEHTDLPLCVLCGLWDLCVTKRFGMQSGKSTLFSLSHNRILERH